MSGGAPREVLATLIPEFEKRTGHHVKINYVLISALRQKILFGEITDLVIMSTSIIDNLVEAGRLLSEGRDSFGALKLVAIVKKGTPPPDISTPEAFRNALLNAKSVIYSTPTSTPSGAHLTNLLSQLDIADAVEKKLTYRPALEGGVSLVANGTAELGIYPFSEVIHEHGVTSAGELPDEFQLNLIYGAAVTAVNKNAEPAMELIRYLAAPENRETWHRLGFDPPPP
ncbi:MAG: molybdate ABC transporter substrate-binding protein [Bradyrhizobiaceae bacterium]|nr:MAG: molybdate ABC transporter substrate-binding protein [Bradyrhizobiaceae bacterium]